MSHPSHLFAELKLRDVTLANPPGASRPQMLSARRVEVPRHHRGARRGGATPEIGHAHGA